MAVFVLACLALACAAPEGRDKRERASRLSRLRGILTAMSENLDLVRSIYAAIGRGDYSSAEWADPEIEYVRADGPEPGSVRGLDGLVQAMRSDFGALADVRAEAEGYRELDAERVLVLTRASGRGKTSGLPVVQKGAELFEIQDGNVTRVVVYFDRERALTGLGLEE